MKNKKIQKILSSVISLSIISSVIPVTQVVNAESSTSGLYSSPEVYINDTFAQSSSLGTEDRLTGSGEPVVTASGWDVTGGAYLTGKNSGGDFDLVDNSTSAKGVMVKKLTEEISDGMVQWEFTAQTKELTSTFSAFLADGNDRALATIRFNKGDILFLCGTYSKSIGSYIQTVDGEQSTALVKIKAYINLSDKTITIYLNGAMVIKELSLGTVNTISKVQIEALKGSVGTLNICECKITKDFILHESFDNERYPREWNNTITSPYRGMVYEQLKLEAGKMAERDISHGNVKSDERVEFHYRFVSDSLVNADKVMSVQAAREYKNLLPDGMANCDTADALGSSDKVFKYSVVTDSTAVDGKSMKASNASNAVANKNVLFEYAISYQELQSKGKDFNLSFDIRKSSDLRLDYSNGVTNQKLDTFKFQYYAKYTTASGINGSTEALVAWSNNSPIFLDNDKWQDITYNYDVDYAAVEAAVLAKAGEGAAINEIVFEVYSNGTEASKISSGSFWLDNICVAPLENSSEVMALNLTSDGVNGFITLTGSGATPVTIGKYRPGIWQNVRITYDRGTRKATVRHNHLTETVVPVNNIAPENLIFANNGTGTITVDDVTVKKVYDLPSDYVLEPQEPADDGYYSSLLSCALWTENGGRGWDAISGFDERSSILGFYDEGKPEVSDWEIKYMVEHGIDSQIFCWYDADRNNNGGAIPAFKDAEYSDMLDYSLLWTNTASDNVASLAYRDLNLTTTKSFQKLFKEVYVPYWIDNYFSDNNYTKLDGKPVLYIFSGAELLTYLGGGNVSVVTEHLKYLNDKCVEAGLNGVKVFLYNGDSMIDGTYAVGSFTYGYNVRNPQALDSMWTKSETADNTALPVLSVHHNKEAWSGNADQYTTPAEYELLANEVKSRMANWNYSKMYSSSVGSDKNGASNEKLLVVNNWNEFGEGHFLMPTKTFGFTYLDIFRKTFTGDSDHSHIEPTENQLKRINMLYDQTRKRRKGSNVASADNKHNVVKLWDFTKSGMSINNIGEGKLDEAHIPNLTIEEGVGLQGITTSAHALIEIGGLNINLDETGYDTIYLRLSENRDTETYVFMNTKYSYTNDEGKIVTVDVTGNLGSDDTKVAYTSDWNSGLVREHFVYMKNHQHWRGTLTAIEVRLPVSLGNSFVVEAIGLGKSNMFKLGDELVTNGSFEKGVAEYTYDGVTAAVSNYDFNRGVASLEVSGNGTVMTSVPGVEANATYQLEVFAKLPFGTTTDSSLTAYLSYTADGQPRKSNELTLTKFLDQGYARLYDELEIVETSPISDVKLCIKNAGGTKYYLDDISLRKLTSVHTDSEHVLNGIKDGIKLEFAEAVDVTNATAVCLDETRKPTLAESTTNTVIVPLPTAAAGRNTMVISGIKTACGEEVGIIPIDILCGVDSINATYYTGYGTDSQATVTSSNFVAGTTVTGVAKITNNSTTKVTGNVISAFYEGNELLKVVFTPFTASGSTNIDVKYDFEVPSGFDDYKEFVWSTKWESLLK